MNSKGVLLTGLFLTLLILFIVQLVSLVNFKFFAPKVAEAKRDVYEQTSSFVEGKRQMINKYYLEYSRADDETTKNAILSTVRREATSLDITLLKDKELENFVTLARTGRVPDD